MINEFSRSELLLGTEAMDRIKKSKIIIFGIGGVGSYVAEALARSGVGSLTLVDNDDVSITNINRQLVALHSTIGMKKTEVMKRRIADINPAACVNTAEIFYDAETADYFDFKRYDYIVDAIDTVTSKILIAVRAQEAGTPVISSMGAGNKINPSGFEVADLFETSVCPLARVMRRELKVRGVKKLKVVYSKEMPRKPCMESDEVSSKKQVPGSMAFVPSIAGLTAAGEIIKDICNIG